MKPEVLDMPLSSLQHDPEVFVPLTKWLGLRFLFAWGRGRKEKTKTKPQKANL